jgi:arginine exporter protein ArgO
MGEGAAVEPLILGVIAGFGIAIPVGAIAVLIVQTGVRCGFRCAASAGAGAATADLVYASLAVIGGATLAASIASIQEPLRWISAAILVAIAVVGLRRTGAESVAAEAVPPSRAEYAGTYARFLGLTIVNPLTVVYFATIVLGTGLASGLTAAQGVTFALGAFLASLSWQTLLAASGGITRHKLPQRFHARLSVAGNLLVLAMAGLLLIRA